MMNKNNTHSIIIFQFILLLNFSFTTVAQQDSGSRLFLFTNVNIFDGKRESLRMDMDLLVENNLIKEIGKNLSTHNATIIDCGGRTLMPGIIEGHSHLALSGITFADVLFQQNEYSTIQSTIMARDMLMNGVTCTRDMAGPVFGLKRAIDEGLILGPRIYPAGAMISQTSGHADFRLPVENNYMLGGDRAVSDIKGYGTQVDGVPLVLAATREQLRLGASHVKLAIGGSVSGINDPIDVTQFTAEEIQAAVASAENWGTYVTVHGYTVRAVNQAIEAGIKCVEHGQLLDKPTLERMAKEGIWLSIQPFTECHEEGLTEAQNEKQAIVCKGTGKVYEWIKEIPALKVVHGTDIFISPGPGIGVSEQVKQMERLLDWFSPYEILKMSTGNLTELLNMSGPRNPYPDADLGVIKVGAYADLLILNGNPLEDIKMVTDNSNIRIIMKDGKIYKNSLEN